MTFRLENTVKMLKNENEQLKSQNKKLKSEKSNASNDYRKQKKIASDYIEEVKRLQNQLEFKEGRFIS